MLNAEYEKPNAEYEKPNAEYEKPLAVHDTNIAGLKVVDLSVHADARGWFKENWQSAKMGALGIPNLHVVQNNVSFNVNAGTTRGIHAEPWDKFVSLASGKVFGAWVDLREGSATFGACFTCTLDPTTAIYVPRGVGNSFQALENNTVCTYLVNKYWSAALKHTYTFVNLADPDLNIPWPIPLDKATISEADKNHPLLKDVAPMPPKRTLVTGCNGQLGQAVRALAQKRCLSAFFDFKSGEEFDIASADAYDTVDWDCYATVINCAAYTAVDVAETLEGRAACWATNATGPALLARTCAAHDITLVHVSSDYVFDGTAKVHGEDEAFSPLNVYGQAKAAGDLAVATCPQHYLIRSSWLVGNGNNFVRTMCALSNRVAAGELDYVTVVNDQIGRLTFANQAAEALFWLLGYRQGDLFPSAPCEYGTYNVTGAGAVKSFAEIARMCFNAQNGNGENVVPVSTAEYCANAKTPVAQRPHNSALSLAKLEATGFPLRNWENDLNDYLHEMRQHN